MSHKSYHLFWIIGILVLLFVGGWYFIKTPVPAAVDNSTPPEWQEVTVGDFTIAIPSAWRHHKLQGIDSQVGEIIGSGTILNYDFGRYSGSLADKNEPEYFVAIESIDGYPVKVVYPAVAGKGTVGVSFSELPGSYKLTITGEKLDWARQQQVLEIFHTIKFHFDDDEVE